jgi:hypothetical protein
MKVKAKSTRSDGFGSANSGVQADAKTSPKPGALLIAEAKTPIVNASKGGELRIGCNSSMTMLLLAWQSEDAALPDDSLGPDHWPGYDGPLVRWGPFGPLADHWPVGGPLARLHKLMGARAAASRCRSGPNRRTMALQKCAIIRHAPDGVPDGKHLVVLDG